MDYETGDFYSDKALTDDPHAYFKFLRNKAPVTPLPYRGVVAVTGYDETVLVMNDAEHFSSINAATGAMTEIPPVAGGDDITDQLEAVRPQVVFAEQIATLQGTAHKNQRSLLSSLFTPSRLRELEGRLRDTSNSLIDEFIDDGIVDLPLQYGGPYATIVISHLLGVPEDGVKMFRDVLQEAAARELNEKVDGADAHPLMTLGRQIYVYLAERRAVGGIPDGTGRPDILSQMALATYPDGTEPPLDHLAAMGAFLFAAGQDTTNLLLTNGFRLIATRPDIQQELRDNPARIPDFVEEILRFDGSVISAGRLCQKTTTVGGVEIKAGTPILLSHMAANRDPERFENPEEFIIGRSRGKEHVAFGRGPHTCLGAPLARREVQISIERLLSRMGNIRISEKHHGPKGSETFSYAHNYTLRKLRSLYLEFDRI